VKHRAKWRSLRNVYGKIGHIREDWLTPCDYLPLIHALLGDLDLDPCSTHDANQQFLRAKQIYTLDDDGLNIEAPWTGKTYLFPPTYGRCTYSKQRGTWRWSPRGGSVSKAPSVIWFRRLVKEWKLRNIPEALFYTTYPEMLRTCPELWDFPLCFPKDRAVSSMVVSTSLKNNQCTGAILCTCRKWSTVLLKPIVLSRYSQSWGG